MHPPSPILWRLVRRGGRAPFLGRGLTPAIRRVAPTVRRRADGGWSFAWPVGRAPYALYLDGVLQATVATEAYEFTGPGYETEAPALEVVDAGAAAEGLTFPPFVVLRWRGLPAAIAYQVEQLVAAVWTTRVLVHETADGEYEFASQAQTDGDATQWRVRALDLQGNAGAALAFAFAIVRNPAPPAVSLAIAGGVLTVSAA